VGDGNDARVYQRLRCDLLSLFIVRLSVLLAYVCDSLVFISYISEILMMSCLSVFFDETSDLLNKLNCIELIVLSSWPFFIMVNPALISHLARNGSWVSYNIPYFPFIYDVSGTLAMYQSTNNSEFSYSLCARATVQFRIFFSLDFEMISRVFSIFHFRVEFDMLLFYWLYSSNEW